MRKIIQIFSFSPNEISSKDNDFCQFARTIAYSSYSIRYIVYSLYLEVFC